MIVDCEIVEYMLNTGIVFILPNEKTFFLLYINQSTINEIPKKFCNSGTYLNTQG